MSMGTDNRSVAELFSDALNQFTKLIRNEVRLARAELSAKLGEAAVGIGMIAAGGFISIAAMVLLLLALSVWLAELGLPEPVGHLIAGVVGLLICGALVWLGMKRLSPEHLTPNRTIEQVQRDVVAVREHVT